jgi:hypothetical protein
MLLMKQKAPSQASRNIAVAALAVALAGCGAPEQATVRLVEFADGGSRLEVVFTAEETDAVELQRFVVNDGTCRAFHFIGHDLIEEPIGTMKKGTVMRVKPMYCSTSGVYKASLVAKDGTTWDYNF